MGRTKMRAAIEQLPGSKIREVANAGIGPRATCWRSGSAKATSRRRSSCAMRRPNRSRGRDLLRPQPRSAGVARSDRALHERRCIREVTAARIAVTSSGVNALMIAMQALAGAGDEVVVVVPVWPNLPAQPAILGAT